MSKFKSLCGEEDHTTTSASNMEMEPRLIVTGFDEQSVNDYIYRLEKITQMFGPDQPIVVEIDSFGGSAYGLLKLIEAFNSIENQVITYCRSKAMSAGLILFSVIASKGCRIASPNARFMLHELQSIPSGGDIKDINVQHKEINFLNDFLMGLLAKSIDMESREDIKSLIRTSGEGNELYFSSPEGKSIKFIDEISYLKIAPVTYFNVMTNPSSRKELEEKQEKEELELEIKETKPKSKKKK